MNNSNSNLLKLRKCYICDQNESESDYSKSIFQLKTKHSETLIYKLVEKFLENAIQKKRIYDENRNIICHICALKIDEYDLAILTAQNIEYDLTQLMIHTNEKYENVIDEFLILNKHDNTTENIENKILVDNNCQRNAVICNENVDDIDYVCDYVNTGEDDSDFEINLTEENVQYSNNDNTENKIVTTTSTTNENNIVKKSDDCAKAPISVPAVITTKTNAVNNLNTTNSSHITKQQLNDKCFKCSKCESFYSIKMDLIEHQKIHNNRQAICDICGKTFSSEGTLNVHVNNLHRILTPFRCEVCGKDFTRRGAIHRHMRIHTGEKKYQCEKCGKKFIHQSSFRAHNLIHDNIRNVKCPICGFAFRINSHLRVHMLVHTGEKPHACPTCGRTFAKRCNMYAHYKSHHDIYRIYENLHICLICNISFRKAATLVEHVSQHYLNSSSKIEISKEININSTDADSFSDNSYSATSDSNSSV